MVDDGRGYLTTLSVFEPMLSRIVKNANIESSFISQAANECSENGLSVLMTEV